MARGDFASLTFAEPGGSGVALTFMLGDTGLITLFVTRVDVERALNACVSGERYVSSVGSEIDRDLREKGG